MKISGNWMKPALGALMIVALAGCSGSDDWEQGKELMKTGKYPEAAELFRKAAADDPENADIQADLARALTFNVTGKTFAEIEQSIAAVKAAGKTDIAAELDKELVTKGRGAFTWGNGDPGLASLGVRLFNAGDAELKDPVVRALLADPALVKAHYATLKMEGKEAAFAEAIRFIDGSKPESVRAAAAVYDAAPNDGARDALAVHLSNALQSEDTATVAMADGYLSRAEFATPAVAQTYKTIYAHKPPESAAGKAGLAWVMAHEAEATLQPLLYQVGNMMAPEKYACDAAPLQRVVKLTAALSTEGGKAALAGPLAASKETLAATAAAVIAANPPCKAEWESLSKAAGG